MRSLKLFAALAFGLALAFNAAAGDYLAVARWHQSAESVVYNWMVDHTLSDTSGVATMTFTGKRPVYCTHKNSVAVSCVSRGDCFVFTFPLGGLPAGAIVDFGTSLSVTEGGGPERWVCEVLDGGRWRSDDGRRASLTVKKYKGGNPSTYLHSFTLKAAVKDEVQVRLRSLDSSENPDAKIYFPQIPWISAYLSVSTIPERDRRNMLLLGNSFTYFCGTYYALREIARSQGHGLDMTLNLKGGVSFGQHLKLEKSQEALSSHVPYDVALLQNGSVTAAQYISEIVRSIAEDCVAMAGEVRKYSPKARVVLERTWSYANKDYRGFGSYEAFDAALQEGAEKLSAKMDAELSPIGQAFILGRERGLKLYWRDNFHQNFTGAYLKACVNYLLLFGEPFNDSVSDYTLDPATAALCRAIAAEVVPTSKN